MGFVTFLYAGKFSMNESLWQWCPTDPNALEPCESNSTFSYSNWAEGENISKFLRQRCMGGELAPHSKSFYDYSWKSVDCAVLESDDPNHFLCRVDCDATDLEK